MGVAPWDPVDDDDRRFAAGSPALPPQVDIASAAQSRPRRELYQAALKVHAPTLAGDAATGICSCTDPSTERGLGIRKAAPSQGGRPTPLR
jgi:hypothetical protein